MKQKGKGKVRGSAGGDQSWLPPQFLSSKGPPFVKFILVGIKSLRFRLPPFIIFDMMFSILKKVRERCRLKRVLVSFPVGKISCMLLGQWFHDWNLSILDSIAFDITFFCLMVGSPVLFLLFRYLFLMLLRTAGVDFHVTDEYILLFRLEGIIISRIYCRFHVYAAFL